MAAEMQLFSKLFIQEATMVDHFVMLGILLDCHIDDLLVLKDVPSG